MNVKGKPKVIAVVGTTASGKSALALALAKHFGGEIVSVDSRQIYQEMNIGTNKDAGEIVEREVGEVPGIDIANSPIQPVDVLRHPYIVEGVPNYMISVVRPDQLLTLAHFQVIAFVVIDDILKRGKLPILVGGTGLYTTAILQNWQLPKGLPDATRRKELEAMTIDQLAAKLKTLDTEAYEVVDRQNPRRLIRAIEMAEEGQGAGRPKKGEPHYDALYLAPDVDKDVLNKRIDARVDAMIKAGLVDEVAALATKYGYDAVAMTGHAYQQIGWFLQGKISQAEAVALSKKVTRAYAKRQRTWWKKYGPVTWITDADQAHKIVGDWLSN